MVDISEMFLYILYDMSEGETRSINRYEVGDRLDLPEEETDRIVDRLRDTGMITMNVGFNIRPSPNAKSMLEKKRAN